MAIFTTLLRRAAMLRLLPLTTAIAFLFAQDRPEAWSDYWVASSGHVAESVIFLGPLVAGAAAWDAKRFQRAGSVELVEVAARSTTTATVAEAAAQLAWALPPYLVVLAAQWVQMQPVAVGGPDLPVLGVGFGLVAVLALFGSVAGSYLPRFVGPAVVAITSYAALIFPPSWDSEVAAHFSVSRSICCPINSIIDPDLLRSQAVYLVALALFLLAARSVLTPWVRGDASPRLVGSAAGALMAGVGLVALLASMPAMLEPNRDGFADRPPPADPACAGSAPEVCTWPEYEGDLESLERAATEIAVAVAAVGGPVPERFAEPGLFPDDASTRIVAPQGPSEGYQDFVGRLAQTFLPEPPPCAFAEDGEMITYPGVGLQPLMAAYLTDRAGQPETARLIAGEPLVPFLEATLAAPLEAQAAWYAANLEVMSTCDREPVLAPPA